MQKQISESNQTTYVWQLYDLKARTWSTPSYATEEANDNWCSFLVNTHGVGATHTHPSDFVLYRVGEYDTETGLTSLYSERDICGTLMGYSKGSCKQCEKHNARMAELVTETETKASNSYSKAKGE